MNKDKKFVSIRVKMIVSFILGLLLVSTVVCVIIGIKMKGVTLT